VKPEGQKDKDCFDRSAIQKVEMDLEEIGWKGGCGLDPSGSGQGPVSVCCKQGDELLGSIKCGEVLD
jgi:hypothetical protein